MSPEDQTVSAARRNNELSVSAILSLILASVSLVAGAPKVALRGPSTTDLRAKGFGDARIRFIGAAELSAAAALAAGIICYPPLGLAAATGMTLLLGSAVGYHARWGDFTTKGARAKTLPAVACVALAAATVGSQFAVHP